MIRLCFLAVSFGDFSNLVLRVWTFLTPVDVIRSFERKSVGLYVVFMRLASRSPQMTLNVVIQVGNPTKSDSRHC